jgi:hypothetical protein
VWQFVAIWRGKYRWERSYRKLKRSLEEGHTWKLIQNILTITDVFVNLKRVNVYEHMVKKASCKRF